MPHWKNKLCLGFWAVKIWEGQPMCVVPEYWWSIVTDCQNGLKFFLTLPVTLKLLPVRRRNLFPHLLNLDWPVTCFH